MELTDPTSPALTAGIWTGRQQAFAAIAGKCKAAKAACLKQIHETRAYEQLGLKWDEFCPTHAGISRPHADELIRRYTELGEEYFRLSEIAHISPATYRTLAPQISGDSIEIEGEQIPILPENGPKIRAGIRRLQDNLKTALEHDTPYLGDFYQRVNSLVYDIYKYHRYRIDRAQPGLNPLVNYIQEKMRRLAEEIENPSAPQESEA